MKFFPKKRIRKTDLCLNCDYNLSLEDNFCPNCGQRNDDNNLSFFEMIKEFFANYFSLDSKLGNSIKPFFLNPGKLTNKFNEGKRVSYVNPVRLYIIISFIYFLIINLAISDLSNEDLIDYSNEENPEASQDNVNFDEISANDQDEDSISNIQDENPENTTNSDYKQTKSVISYIFKYAKVDSISDQALLDSLNLSPEKDKFERRSAVQLRKLIRQPGFFVDFMTKNLSIMMFILLPIFALVLKLFYIRSSILYIKHLIHSLHLHAFAFLIFSIALLLLQYFTTMGWIGLSSFLLVVIYATISFKKVYNQTLLKTMLKIILFGMTYFWLLIFALVIEFMLSLYLF